MKKILSFTLHAILLYFLCVLTISCGITDENDFTERTKIALRDVGNRLLLSNQDSTSLILPVKAIETNKFQLNFDKHLKFEPSKLVSIVQESFKSVDLPQHYRVEVLNCDDREVAYSYQMSDEDENTITPCGGRFLPDGCYSIEVKFTERKVEQSSNHIIAYIIGLLALLVLGFLIFKKRKHKQNFLDDEPNEKLGLFRFYPEQNKLVKEAEEIALSKKECELLALFVAHPNQIIKRDELTKRVWEDNGVYVSRSLDTYISKLRKKLKADTSIKLTNVHGVGYKLEISQ
ncbi:winged helix-turn-helix domain-containing protein [Winogradskyella sp.]|uniref:winged helix-turn-helix domain-containing protein n=1 Tax=Winogradskyella sp. TaxID=1883156 RepID=UPI003F6D9235